MVVRLKRAGRIGLWLSIVAVGGAAFLVLKLKGVTEPHAPVSTTLADENAGERAGKAASNSELGDLRAELAQHRARLATLEAERTDRTESAPAPLGSARERVKRTREDIKQQRAENIAMVQHVSEWFEHEERDEGWAAPAEAHLNAVLRSSTFAGSRILASGCKKSLCRVEARHDSVDSRDTFELVRRELPGNYRIQHIEPDDTGGDSTLRTIAFFVRPGHERENPLFDAMYSPR
jgi:hypothetical protein